MSEVAVKMTRRLIEMEQKGDFASHFDPQVLSKLKTCQRVCELLPETDESGQAWPEEDLERRLDEISGQECSVALFEVASVLEESECSYCHIVAAVLRSIAEDQDSAETEWYPNATVWLTRDGNGDKYGGWEPNGSGGLCLENIGVCECPNCRTNVEYDDLSQFAEGVPCEGCGGTIKLMGIGFKMIAEPKTNGC